MDKLERLLSLQRGLMARLGIVTHDVDEVTAQRETRDLLFAICCELGETGDEINWKPWKRTVKPVDLSALRTELIDILHFALELCLIWGLDAQGIFDCYQEKMAENHARQERGY